MYEDAADVSNIYLPRSSFGPAFCTLTREAKEQERRTDKTSPNHSSHLSTTGKKHSEHHSNIYRCRSGGTRRRNGLSDGHSLQAEPAPAAPSPRHRRADGPSAARPNPRTSPGPPPPVSPLPSARARRGGAGSGRRSPPLSSLSPSPVLAVRGAWGPGRARSRRALLPARVSERPLVARARARAPSVRRARARERARVCERVCVCVCARVRAWGGQAPPRNPRRSRRSAGGRAEGPGPAAGAWRACWRTRCAPCST